MQILLKSIKALLCRYHGLTLFVIPKYINLCQNGTIGYYEYESRVVRGGVPSTTALLTHSLNHSTHQLTRLVQSVSGHTTDQSSSAARYSTLLYCTIQVLTKHLVLFYCHSKKPLIFYKTTIPIKSLLSQESKINKMSIIRRF